MSVLKIKALVLLPGSLGGFSGPVVSDASDAYSVAFLQGMTLL